MPTMSAQSDRFRVLDRLTEIRFEDELRGYSKNQVDRVLETLSPLAQDVQQLQDKLAAAERRVVAAEARLLEQGDAATFDEGPRREAVPPSDTAPAASGELATPPPDFDETLRKTLVRAQRTADTVVREANEEAQQIRVVARSEADELIDSSRADADRLRFEGEKARSDMMTEVEEEHDSLLAAAHDRATATIRSIEDELTTVHASQREELVQQIGELEQVRDILADDIENFEGYLAQRRETVRAAMSEINVVLDDPTRLRPSIPPAVSDTGWVDPGAFEPIKVELQSLSDISRSSVPGNSAPQAPAEAHIERDSLLIDTDTSEGDVTEGDASEGDVTESDVTLSEAAVNESLEGTAAVNESLEGTAADVAEAPRIDLTDAAESEAVEESDKFTSDTAGPGEGTGPKDVTGASAATRMKVKRNLLVERGASDELAEALDEPAQVSEPERPAWADAVPDQDGDSKSSDPFLDELRKATSTQNEDDEALSRFMSDEVEESSRGGWFGRRR